MSSCLAAVVMAGLTAPTALAVGGVGEDKRPKPPASPSEGPAGGATGQELNAAVDNSSIEVTQTGGVKPSASSKGLIPVDPNWTPPPCWYEPVATSNQLEAGVDRLKKGGELVRVTPSLWWGERLMVDHYEDGKPQSDGDAGYEKFNRGKKGKFWRGVVNKSAVDDPASYDCDRTLFWQATGTIPEDKNAPTPDVLAGYAYDKINVPDTKVELKPEGKSTVNLPTWVWLDKGSFDEVKVRAELPGTACGPRRRRSRSVCVWTPEPTTRRHFPRQESAGSTTTEASEPHTRRAPPTRTRRAGSGICGRVPVVRTK